MFITINSETVGSAIEESMRALHEQGQFKERENQDRKETVKEIQLVINISKPANEPMISKAIPCDKKALKSYIHEFIDGTADDLGWKYTYHQLYAPYYPKLIEELKRCKDSRRACIALGQGDINFTGDPPCLQLINVDITNEAVNMTVYFRSNDGVKAFPMNIQAIAMLQLKIAVELGLGVGELRYIANNFHCYHNDIKTLENYIHIFDKNKNNPKRRFWQWTENDYKSFLSL